MGPEGNERVEFSYELEGKGWSRARLRIGERRAEVTASYLSDALRDLMAATLAIVEGADQASVSWAEEPGEYRWALRRASGNQMELRVKWFDKLLTRRTEGSLHFDASCDVNAFAAAIGLAARTLLQELGADGYARQWGKHDFPLSELRALEAATTKPGDRP